MKAYDEYYFSSINIFKRLKSLCNKYLREKTCFSLILLSTIIPSTHAVLIVIDQILDAFAGIF